MKIDSQKSIAMRDLFSKRLSELMQKQDINQVELSKIVGVSESAVGKWLLKKMLPRMGMIQKLADYFGVPTSFFLEEHPSCMNSLGFNQFSLSDSEISLIKKIRSLSPEGQSSVYDFINFKLISENAKKKPEKDNLMVAESQLPYGDNK
ncbi:helix-turn-helix transcriptional regulator [Megasphaera sp. DJF_B143]|uniref:helix-turn-helix domain-containing protein n=1 Tax=Megasphaera sp. DJF_B143 TaxID=537288 RepID=UPI00073F55B5|nr:helix-turn-helix transcriptional regulator [Megasphaera sp. DJF_B143]KUH55866.1 hypothetical protein AT798_04625 [Megasphaera sp. DJF_B143]